MFFRQVAHVKKAMNPDGWQGKTFPASSHIKFCAGISKPLHFLFERDGDGRGCLRTKLNARQELWSEPFYPLKCENNGLDAPDHEHKLSLDAIDMYVKPRAVRMSQIALMICVTSSRDHV